ncbi:MAG TPA: M24 family metallopeptidase [Nocardioidaceae bacterium]|nr:M24 family metallopeptidase [Nocardioidaceae bacterium]
MDIDDVDIDAPPDFTPAEMKRRHRDLLAAAMDQGVNRVLSVGVQRFGSAIQWLTGWPVTREAYVLSEEGRPDCLYVGYFNHVPQATELAAEAEVSWVGPSPVETVLAELSRRGPVSGGRIGVLGPLSVPFHRALVGAGLEVVDLGRAYIRLRQVKSAEELAWLQRGAELSDAGIDALVAGLRSGLTEYDLCDLVERAYVPLGGTTHIHYFGVTSMADPRRANPAQYPSARRVAAGDAVVVELSAAYRGHPGQVLRTFAVETEPTPLYRDLHAVAEAAFAAVRDVLRPGTTVAEIQAAAGVIEDAGFTTVDDLVHGFGGGYLPPVIGSKSRDHAPAGDDRVRAGMTVVVQPNVATTDHTAGVQFGELVHIDDDGARSLHRAPGGLLKVP